MRQILSFVSAGIIAVVSPLSFTATAQNKFGVQLYSFRNQMPNDVPGMLKKIKETGITELEGGDTYGLSVEAYRKLLDDNGLKMVGIGGDFTKLQTDLPAIISLAKQLGASYVTCFWIPHEEGTFTPENTEKAAEVFNTAGKTLKENGLSFCYHPHGYEFRPYGDGTLFDYLVEKTNPAYVNFEMDVFWVKHAGVEPVSLLEKYPSRFLLMHLKDRRHGTIGNNNGRADVECNVTLGTGDVGIEAILKAAKKTAVKHFFIEDESSRSEQQVPESMKYLNGLK
jgi:sugar phosphate isomerase/epimerase